jgi:hypothetical protein
MGELDTGPVVPALALTARATRQRAPAPIRQGGDERVGTFLGAGMPDGMIRGDGEDIGMALGFQPVAQLAGVAVDGVPRHPGRRDAGRKRTRQHLLGQLRLGGKPHRVGNACFLPPYRISGPFAGQIQLAVKEGPARGARIAEEDPNLAVLPPPRGAAVLALDADRFGPLLEEARLVHDEHPVGST